MTVSMGQTGQAEKAGTVLTGHAGIKTKSDRQHGSDRTGGKGRHNTDRPCRHQDKKLQAAWVRQDRRKRQAQY